MRDMDAESHPAGIYFREVVDDTVLVGYSVFVNLR